MSVSPEKIFGFSVSYGVSLSAITNLRPIEQNQTNMVRCTKAKTVLPCLTLKEMGKSYNENAKGSHTFHPPSCWTNVSSSKPPNHARIRHHHCMRELPAPDYRSSWDRINFQSDVASHRVRKSIRTHQQWVKNVYEQRACFVAFASSLFCKYSLKI